MTSRQDGDPPGSSGGSPESVDSAIGRRVKTRREELGLDLRAMAAETSLSIDDLSEIESGRQRAGAAILSALAIVLDVPISYFFFEFEPDGQQGAAQTNLANRGET